jgi:hypothetical protein
VIGAILNGVQTDDGVYQYYSYDTQYAIAGADAPDAPDESQEVARIGDGR